MQLIFKGGNEIIKFVIDRDKKMLQVASSKTNQRLQRMPWRYLFDPGKEKAQEEATDVLDDDKFKAAIILEMATAGYKLIKDD